MSSVTVRLSPCKAIRVYRHKLPAPFVGGGRRRGTRREVGVTITDGVNPKMKTQKVAEW
ncbi:hypothetical protein [Methanoculleus sp.]|uniref:hypothetical protein n=1 Tax=Methanoculleus sp. TaxID=90427 RepID=UPI002626AA28|nr:hypothetical protein [Methanoculleus sp.]